MMGPKNGRHLRVGHGTMILNRYIRRQFRHQGLALPPIGLNVDWAINVEMNCDIYLGQDPQGKIKVLLWSYSGKKNNTQWSSVSQWPAVLQLDPSQ